ncbi:envelope stress response membrane protein PspB [Lichenicoccus sp.]|uniref:envelope stress response membrane protein PspB n=1 Tax=Lichenicoccus sp. TaxID=2781899 RepID=UPI003D0C37E7
MDSIASIVAVLGPFLVPLGGMVLAFFLIRMRHESRMRQMNVQGLSHEEQRALAEMSELARRMEQRIDNLERVLDSEVAGWRSRVPL